MIRILVPVNETPDWLSYQSEYRCVMPTPELIAWMTEQGYQFRIDWNFEYRDYKRYMLTFKTEAVYIAFMIGWY